MNQFDLIDFLVLAAAIAIFTIQNSGEVVVTFIGWQFHSSPVVVIRTSRAVGVIMPVLLSLPGASRLQTQLREQAQRIGELEQQPQDRESKSVQDRL